MSFKRITLLDSTSSHKKYLYIPSDPEADTKSFWKQLQRGVSEKFGYEEGSFLIMDKNNVEIEADSVKYINWENEELLICIQTNTYQSESMTRTTSTATTVDLNLDELIENMQPSMSSSEPTMQDSSTTSQTWSLDEYKEEKQILLEFKLMYPGKENRLLEYWDQITKAIMEITLERNQWHQHGDIKRFVEDYKNGENISQKCYGFGIDEMFFLTLLHLLPYLGGKKKTRVPISLAFSQLFIFEKTSNAIDALIRVPGRPKQPYILCLGTCATSIEDYYVVIELSPIHISGGSALNAIDFVLKSSFALHIHYELGVSNLFKFLQTTIFGIDSENQKWTGRVLEIMTHFLNKIPALSENVLSR